jgi:DNA-binding SARP family transcriptional activator
VLCGSSTLSHFQQVVNRIVSLVVSCRNRNIDGLTHGGIMEIRILGPLTVRGLQNRKLTLPPKPRQVLALLVTHPDEIVPTSALLRELWDERPPRTAKTTLQTYIGQLRRLLATALGVDLRQVAEEVLVTADGGYGLFTSDGWFDVQEYVRLGNLGKAAVRSGADIEGSRLLGEALDLWRGPALVNVDPGPLLEAQIYRLEECRLCCIEHRVVAELRLGEHAGLVSELVELAARYPLHESMQSHLMVALYRCGRRSEALAVFRRLRARLVEETGLEPSAELLRLHQAILTTDPSLELPHSGLGLALPAVVAV